MARKPSRSGDDRTPFSASSTLPARKPKPKSKRKLDPSNAYTYLPSLPKRHRTSEATLSLSHDEIGASKSRRKRDEDDEEDEAMDDRIKKVAITIADEGPGEVGSGESDVDSDRAWEEEGSDEERWGDVSRGIGKNKGKKAREVIRKPAEPLTVDLNEDEDEFSRPKRSAAVKFDLPERTEADDSSSEHSDGSSNHGEAEAIGGQPFGDADDQDDVERGQPFGTVENDEEEEEEEAEEEEEDEGSEVALPSDLSADEDEPDELDGLDSFVEQLASADKKRKGGGEEVSREEAAKKRRVLPVGQGTARTGSSNQKLDISTLIASHPSLAGASALLPSKADKRSSSSILKHGILSAPLPTVVQERLNREAAYEKTKEEGAKWAGVMKRVKEAQHLSFPLQGSDRGGVKSSGEMLAGFKPENKLESAVHALLQQANLTDVTMARQEDHALEAQELSIEEIAARRAQLRQQRELMFRAESRAKRVAKIKSKTFRKLARKRQERAGGDIDLDRLDPEEADEEREKLERSRATERATLRHGARNGRWAREVGGDGGEVEGRRKAKEDMLDIKERLQRKIMGRDEGQVSSSDEETEEDEADEDAIKARAFDQLSDLDAREPGVEQVTGLVKMAFMRKAREREMRHVAEDEKGLRKEIELFGQIDSADEENEEGEEGADVTHMMRVEGNEGRIVFSGPVTGASAAASALQPAQPTIQPGLPVRPRSPSPPPDHNPWLVPSANVGPSRKRNTAAPAPVDKASQSLNKQAERNENVAVEDERVEISVDGPTLLATSGNDDESDEDELLPANGIKAFKQRDLVAEAFAADNVVEDFEREKQRQMEEDAPKTEDASLPGWGSWGGKGVRKRRTDPRFLVQKPGIEPSTRKDFTRSNVIINEKKEKRAQQFLVKDLPYPYTSVAQYERSFDMPLGSEWNSRGVHQRETMPRVMKKPGAIIEPVRRMF